MSSSESEIKDTPQTVASILTELAADIVDTPEAYFQRLGDQHIKYREQAEKKALERQNRFPLWKGNWRKSHAVRSTLVFTNSINPTALYDEAPSETKRWLLAFAVAFYFFTWDTDLWEYVASIVEEALHDKPLPEKPDLAQLMGGGPPLANHGYSSLEKLASGAVHQALDAINMREAVGAETTARLVDEFKRTFRPLFDEFLANGVSEARIAYQVASQLSKAEVPPYLSDFEWPLRRDASPTRK